MNRREVKAELTSFKCPIPLDHTTPELEELLETVRENPRKIGFIPDLSQTPVVDVGPIAHAISKHGADHGA